MKNDLPCEIIKDLLPSYVDNIASDATRAAVEAHLTNCSECSKEKNDMVYESKEINAVKASVNSDDRRLLKKMKKRLNKRIKIAIACSVLSIAALFGLYNLLFCMPLKNVDIQNISVSAQVYPFEELESSGGELHITNETAAIRKYADDTSQTYSIVFPGNDLSVTMSENTIKDSAAATLVKWNSSYSLKSIASSVDDNGTMYVSDIKTTLLGRKSDVQPPSVYLEMRKIEKIIYKAMDGSETILWENKK